MELLNYLLTVDLKRFNNSKEFLKYLKNNYSVTKNSIFEGIINVEKKLKRIENEKDNVQRQIWLNPSRA